jgi:hypothetical protein
MLSSFRHWVIRPASAQAQRALSKDLGLHPITAAVFVARGVISRDDATAALTAPGHSEVDPARC